MDAPTRFTTSRVNSLLLTILLAAFSSISHADCSYHPLGFGESHLPFPSNHMLSDTENGLRLEYCDELYQAETLNNLPELAQPSEINVGMDPDRGVDGFSPATGVYFMLPKPVNKRFMENAVKDNVTAVILVDLTTGEPVPHRVFSRPNRWQQEFEAANRLVEIRPLGRFEYGHTYAAVLTKHVVGEKGERFNASEGLQRLLAGEDPELAPTYQLALDYVESQGVALDSLIALTQFTIRSEPNVTETVLELQQAVLGQNQTLVPDSLTVSYKASGSIAAIVEGKLQLNDFRDPELGYLVRKQEGWQSNTYQVPFVMSVPRSASTQPAPVAIYGHGIGVSKETFLLVAFNNANLGAATVAIDYPHQGERIELNDEPDLQEMAKDPQNITRVVGMAQQSPLDFLGLLNALKNELGELNVVPQPSGETDSSIGTDNFPDLDTNRIFYQGTSLGSVFGAGFVAMAPDIAGAFFQVGGAGITYTLTHSSQWGTFRQSLPEQTQLEEAITLVNGVQLLIDAMDGLALAHWYRNPPAGSGITPKAMLLQFGPSDQVVPLEVSLALGYSVGSPLLVNDDNPLPVPIPKEDSQSEGDTESENDTEPEPEPESEIENESGLPEAEIDVAFSALIDEHIAKVDSIPEDGTAMFISKDPVTFAFLEQIAAAATLWDTVSHFSFIQPNAKANLEYWMQTINVDQDPDPALPTAGQERTVSPQSAPEPSAGHFGWLLMLIVSGLILRFRQWN